MAFEFAITQLPEPFLEFGGPGEFVNPKFGLRDAGPFDLRFGAAHPTQIRLGIVGPSEMIQQARLWFERCQSYIPSGKDNVARYPDYPGFQSIFRSALVTSDRWDSLIGEVGELQAALSERNEKLRFEKVLDLYTGALERISRLEVARPDVVVCALSDEVVKKCWSITNQLSKEEKGAIRAMAKANTTMQPGLFDELEVSEEDLLFRDFRRALKARAMSLKLPIQIVTNNVLIDKDKGTDPAARAWNLSVALYYKAGGIPWRLKVDGPETCFVGISFFQFKTNKRQLMLSSIAQAFSTEGEGFALRGESIPWDEKQGRNVHLSEVQAQNLGKNILAEYHNRTGGTPLRVVLHKTSSFNDAEHSGFASAFDDVPIVELVNLLSTDLRVIHFGVFPPKRGSLCHINNAKSFLFTTGFIPEIGTYPGMHIPSPMQIQSYGHSDIERVASDILGLTKMNWNTASLSGGQPVTLSFARKIGGVMAEYGEGEGLLSSFRYYI